ncbi:MAG: hypothetical protein M1838_002612 [Thelocarpon superellum]|nr:MAG: hypothetical protein M1838_002612 [Thelocarpon superellum]
METMVGGRQHSDALPSISYLDFAAVKGHGSEYHSQVSTMASTNVPNGSVGSPTSVYSGPPPPYSYQSTTAMSTPSVTSPPHSRRTSGEEKEAPPPRQSLPSIFEALGRDQLLSYPGPAPPLLPHQRSSHHDIKAALPPRSPLPRSRPLDTPHHEPHPAASQALNAPSYAVPPPHTPSTSTYPPSHPADRLPSLHALRTAPSPGQTHRVDTHGSTSQSSPGSDHGQASVNAVNSIHGYGHHQTSQRYPAHTPSKSHSLLRSPTATHASYASRFDGSEVGRVQEAQQSYNGFKGVNGERYGTSVKRHLDFFDLEASLNEIADSSGRVNEFSRDFKDRARELPQTGPVQGALPSVAECDDMIKHQGRVQDLLTRLREMLVTRQNALATQQGSESRYKASSDYDGDEGTSYDDGKADVLLGPDAKKRRGRAAPPGRCHSCNRAETPEWRRGPDGARTLCNACGLHYAKLTRKMGSKGAGTGSALPPKSMGPSSPQ